jgi:hypothetical protein
MKNQHTEQQVVTCPLWTICLNLQQLCSKSWQGSMRLCQRRTKLRSLQKL